MARSNIYRNGRIHVMREKCETCIFRPGNLMMLEPGRVKELVAKAVGDDSAIICHKTLGTRKGAACAGFYEGYATTALQLAARLDLIEFVASPKKEEP